MNLKSTKLSRNLLTTCLAASLGLTACGTPNESTLSQTQAKTIGDIQDLAKKILQDQIDSLDLSDVKLSDEKESYVGGSASKELSTIKTMVKNLGNMMATSYLNEKAEGLNESQQFAGQKFRMLRDAHPQGLLCLQSDLKVNQNSMFKDGLLGTPASYSAVTRFSSSAPSLQADSVRDIRGFAVKVNINGSGFGSEHDFVSLSADTFPTDNAGQFGELVKVARIADCGNDPRGAIACAFDTGVPNPVAVAAAAAKFAGISANEPDNSLLEKSFFGVTPFKYETASEKSYVKFSFKPRVCEENLGSDDRQLVKNNADNFLADNVRDIISAQSACYDLFATKMPSSEKSNFLETHTKTWESISSATESVKVATLTFRQNTPELDANSCDNQTFSPERVSKGFTALGSLNRARALIYQTLAKYRKAVNAAIEDAGLN